MANETLPTDDKMPAIELRLGVGKNFVGVVAVTPDGIVYEVVNAAQWSCRPAEPKDAILHGYHGAFVLQVDPVAFSGRPTYTGEAKSNSPKAPGISVAPNNGPIRP